MENSLEDFTEKKKKELEEKLRTLKTIQKDAINIELILTKEQIDNTLFLLRYCYYEIIELYKKYLDWDIDEIKMQTIWNVATYCYNVFNAFPYRFITAMKGSGKTRLLKLTESLCWNGKLTSGISDSALFRMASNYTLLFDEAEQIARKEKQSQREILNSGYKKGGKVIRVKEKQTKEGKIYVNEEFNTYGPKMLANIFGIENVLGDRCIPSILEKSNDSAKTKMMEDFDTSPNILRLKSLLNELQCSLCSVVTQNNMLGDWNNYIEEKYTNYTNHTNNITNNRIPPTLTTSHTYNTLTTLYTYNTNSTLIKLKEETIIFFNKIDNSGLNGRQLELYFPLFIIANFLGEDILEDMISIAKKKTLIKKEDDFIENSDIALIDFVSNFDIYSNYIFISELTQSFKGYFQVDNEGFDWINTRWMGRALNRLQLLKQKRRTSRGVEVILNIQKAKEKIKMFKIEESPRV